MLIEIEIRGWIAVGRPLHLYRQKKPKEKGRINASSQMDRIIKIIFIHISVTECSKHGHIRGKVFTTPSKKLITLILKD